MKTILLSFFSIISLTSNLAQSVENLETTFISTGEKVRANEVIVRFNDKLLDKDIVDNYGQQKKALNQYLHLLGKEELKKIKKLKFSIEKLQMKKMFKNIKSCDIKSISRTGKVIDVPPFWATFIVDIPTGFTIEETIAELKKAFPVVLFAHPNYIYDRKVLTPTDTNYSTDQHSLSGNIYPNAGINMDSAWTIETGEPFIKVGVFDTGIDREHEDLNVLTYASVNDLTDEFIIDTIGHGTAVAGIIGAIRNNGIGIAGIAGGGSGDALNSPGVSLIDFNMGEINEEFNLDGYANLIIDAARSPLTDYDYPSCNGEAGYGIHVANHSYGLVYKYQSEEEDSTWSPPPFTPDCDLCYEAFLFSLQNGVVNVVSRGNTKSYYSNQYVPNISLPASFPDEWVVNVGASGNDGNRMNGGQNGTADESTFSSPIGHNVDLIAPGSLSIVYTTKSQFEDNSGQKYKNFNGTSASAPHVTGVVALLLSYYNKPDCYSNSNLDPADVEYILQKSAVDLSAPGYDDSTGHGRLDAFQALKMIELPKYQIVHPESLPIQTTFSDPDTIVVELGYQFKSQM